MASPDCGTNEAQQKYGCNAGIEMIARAPFLDKESCNGDSGGPAYMWSGSDWLLAGATSRATKESQRNCGDGRIYTRVDRFEEWMKGIPGGHWPKQ